MNREEKLCKEMKKGNQLAANELVELYYTEILRYCCWHTDSKEQAEDATQETFLKFVRYIDAYKHRGMLRAFLYRIAKNTCIDMSRKKEDVMMSYDMDERHSEAVYEEKAFMKLRRMKIFKN